MRDSDKSLKTKFTDYEVYTFGYPGQKKKIFRLNAVFSVKFSQRHMGCAQLYQQED